MADSGAARRRRAERALQAPRELHPIPGRGVGAELDVLLHHRMRLGIVSALAANASLTFNELKTLMDTTDGNLSVHARKLEDAHYVTVTKRFQDRRPKTEYRITAAGRRALQRYLDHMEALIRATRDTLQHP